MAHVATRAATAGRLSGLAAILGGLLWVPYGVFEMLQPWGADTLYRDDLAYEVVIDAGLYRAYSLPGGLAVLLTALALLGGLAPSGLSAGRAGRFGRFLASIAVGLAALGLVGVIALLDPLFTSGRFFGTLALGAATMLAGVDARRAGGPPGWAAGLLVLGLIGLLLFPLWPLVFALMWVPEGAGAALIALFGVGWVLMGGSSWRVARE